MTHHTNAYPYGFAGCCGCECSLDLASHPWGLTCNQGNLVLYFFFCPDCSASLIAKGPEAGSKAIAKALKRGLQAQPQDSGLAMVTSLALQAHAGDLVRAFEIGVDVPRPLHDAILAGEADAICLPSFDWEGADAS